MGTQGGVGKAKKVSEAKKEVAKNATFNRLRDIVDRAIYKMGNKA